MHKRIAKIVFSQYGNSSESEGGGKAEERFNHCEQVSHHGEASEQPTPPIVQCRKMRSQKAKAEEMVPPKARPPQGRENK